MLANYRDKYEYFRKKNDELTTQISDCKVEISEKDKQMKKLNKEI